jgi:quercetin dioxygenase-like cupin family protein
VIVAPGTGPALVRSTGSAPVRWQSLARRGMLFSECESVEHWDLPLGAVIPVEAAHGVEEAVVVLTGTVTATVDGATVHASAGTCLFIPAGSDGTLCAGTERTQLLSVRCLPAEIAARLPVRTPELRPAAAPT